MFDLLIEIGQTMRNNKLRTALTGIAVAWGIFMLIILLGASRGVRDNFESNVSADDTNVLTVLGGYTSKPHKGYKEGRRITLKTSDMAVIKHDNPRQVSSVAAFASVDTAKISTERDALTNGFKAVYPRVLKGNNLTLKSGRFINERDIQACRRVMIIHEKNARLLFGDDKDAVGKTVRSMGLAWTVVGVYSHPWRSQSYAPYTTLKSITGNDDRAYMLEVVMDGLKTEQDGENAEAKARESIAKNHNNFAPDDRGAVWIINQFTNYLTNKAALGYLDLAMWVIGIFTLLSGIVGVSNIMFVSVRERTHEIGIRRAIGAKPRSILTQVVAESIAITTLFGYIGVVMGMITLEIITSMFEEMKGAIVDLDIAIKVTLALIIAGSLAGLFPAMKATKVKPVEALRDE